MKRLLLILFVVPLFAQETEKEDSTYIIEATQDLRQRGKWRWRWIGKVQGTGSSVKFTDARLPKVPYKRNYFRVKLVE
jgi:hypothetical protein|tara:strand:- start:1179 stop:1412 length:234 start_codon:yes stop_codon:yes gene_type:complete